MKLLKTSFTNALLNLKAQTKELEKIAACFKTNKKSIVLIPYLQRVVHAGATDQVPESLILIKSANHKVRPSRNVVT